VASLRGRFGRKGGIVALRTDVATLADEVAAVKALVGQVNHVVAQLQTVVLELNHDVRSGAEEGLPLFLGYAERLRLDADTAIGATQVIERQLALMEERLAARPPGDES
jgi:hypothetical protein